MSELGSGTRVGPYVLAEPLGEGPGGWWWRGTRSGQRDKSLLACPEMADEELDALRRTIQLHQVISEPSIPTVLDVYTAKEHTFIVSDHLGGTSLPEWLGLNTMSPALGESWFRMLVEAVQQAHGVGLLHLDLSPYRLVISRTDEGKMVPRIPAFGVWAAMDDAGLIMEERLPHEATPEQLRGEESERASDLFFLGMVFFTLLTGRNPFDDPDPAESQRRVLECDYTPVKRLRPSVSAAHEQVIQGLLTPQPRDRLPDCQAILDLLDGKVATRESLMPQPTEEELADWDDFMTEERPRSRGNFTGRRRKVAVEIDEELTPIRPEPPAQAKRDVAGARIPTQVPAEELTEPPTEEVLPAGLFDSVPPPPPRSALGATPKRKPGQGVVEIGPGGLPVRPSLNRPLTPPEEVTTAPPHRAPRPPEPAERPTETTGRWRRAATEDATESEPTSPAPMVSLTPHAERPSPLFVEPSLSASARGSTPPASGPRVPMPLLGPDGQLPPSLQGATPIAPPDREETARSVKRNAVMLRVRLVLVAVLTGVLVLLVGYLGWVGLGAYQKVLEERMVQPVAEAPAPAPQPLVAETVAEPTEVPGIDAEPVAAEAEAEPEVLGPAPEPPPVAVATQPDRPLSIAERSRLASEAQVAPAKDYDPARPPAALRNEQIDTRPVVTSRPPPPRPEPDPPPKRSTASDLPPPPPAVSRKMVSVSYASGPDDIWLEKDGKQYRDAQVPEGSYDIKAVWDGSEVLAGRADLSGAASVTVRCSTGFQRCRIAP